MPEFHPLLLCPPVIQDGKTTFYHPSNEVEVSMPAALARRLVACCDGTVTEEAVIAQLSRWWTSSYLRSVLTELQKHDVLVDGRMIAPFVWRFVSNPSPWLPKLSPEAIDALVADHRLQQPHGKATVSMRLHHTPFSRRFADRRSSRNFGTSPVKAGSLTRILWASYGLTGSTVHTFAGRVTPRRTVPSAGALYPLLVHLVLFAPCGVVSPGVYRVHPNEHEVDLHRLPLETARPRSWFVDPSLFTNAAGLIIVSGSFARTAAKYGNRGLLYAALEAGHVAQNVHLTAHAAGLMTIEVGGFFESAIRADLGFKESVQPLTTVVFGAPHRRSSGRRTLTASDAVRAAVRDVVLAPRTSGGYTTPFTMAFGKVVLPDGSTWWSCGRSKSLAVAERKAVAEGIEWFACSRADAHDLTTARLVELGGTAVDPRSMHAYLPDQFEHQRWVINPFDPDEQHVWRRVIDVKTGEDRFILAQAAYFPYSPAVGRRYMFASSSGNAAHPNAESAFERALYELIERDAFMVTWLNRLRRPVVSWRTLPGDVQRRLRTLVKLGFTARVVDITYDLGAVPLVVAHHPKLPYLTCAAAVGSDLRASLDRALMEVEGSVYCRFRDGSASRTMIPKQVWQTYDHDLLYQQRSAIRLATFLLGDERRPMTFTRFGRERGKQSFATMQAELRRLGYPVFRLNYTAGDTLLEQMPVVAVKAIVPGLVPMSFEYGLEPFALPRIVELPVVCGYSHHPVPAGLLNRFPHPYT